MGESELSSAKIKKLLFMHHYSTSMGAGLCLLHILGALDRTKYTALVYLPPYPGDLADRITELGYQVKKSDAIQAYMHFSGNNTPFLSLSHYKNIRSIQSSEGKIRDIINEEKPDILIVNSLTLCWMGQLAHELNVKTICFDRETFRRGLFSVRTNWIKRCMYRDFDGVAFLSNYDMEQCPEGDGLFRRITDKVDVKLYDRLTMKSARRELNLPENEKLLLYMGGSNYLKGADIAVKAMQYVQAPDVRLVYLQYTKESAETFKAKVKQFIKRLLGMDYQYKVFHGRYMKKVSDRIIPKPATAVPEKYFAAADAVVFPSRMAHQSRPLYEAGIANKPFIITDFPNTREFADHTNAWLFPVGNEKALADCINQIFSGDQENVARKVRKNRERCEKENNLSTLPAELSDFIETVYHRK